MMKEITVVMPVYKVEKYVSECLDSIINQTFDCFECIIIDDCSPDNSMRLIEEKLAGYKGNISFRIVRNERNLCGKEQGNRTIPGWLSFFYRFG